MESDIASLFNANAARLLILHPLVKSMGRRGRTRGSCVRIPAKARRGICEQDTLNAQLVEFLRKDKSELVIRSPTGRQTNLITADNHHI
jgi:hypothetical protein